MRNQKVPPSDPKNVTNNSETNTKLEETAGEEISDCCAVLTGKKTGALKRIV